MTTYTAACLAEVQRCNTLQYRTNQALNNIQEKNESSSTEISAAHEKIKWLLYLHILANKFGVSVLDKSCGKQRSTCLEKVVRN